MQEITGYPMLQVEVRTWVVLRGSGKSSKPAWEMKVCVEEELEAVGG